MDTTWTVDKEVLLALRLDRIEQALRSGRAEHALVEAEELLDEHPAHPMGLFYTGEAALALGAAHTARAALEQCAQLRPTDPTLLSLLATARFESLDFDGARVAALAVITSDRNIPAVWFTRGLVAERQGEAAEARHCFARAELLDPDGHPIPLDLPERLWERALHQARRVLPTAIQAFYVQVPLRWEDFPSAADLSDQQPPLSPLIGALYTGTRPRDDEDPWQVLPDAVRLFRGNLRHNIPPGTTLVERLSLAMLAEALSWTGTPSEEVLTD